MRALDRIFILHADHEQNASTSTVRLARSSGREPVRLHRGRHRLPVGPRARRCERGLPADARSRRSATSPRSANSSKGEGQELGRAPDGLRPPRYKNYDPRAKLMRETCHEVLGELGLARRSLFKLAIALEKIALEDEYFVSAQALPERGLLFGHRAAGASAFRFDVHLHLLACPHRGAGSRSGMS